MLVDHDQLEMADIVLLELVLTPPCWLEMVDNSRCSRLAGGVAASAFRSHPAS